MPTAFGGVSHGFGNRWSHSPFAKHIEADRWRARAAFAACCLAWFFSFCTSNAALAGQPAANATVIAAAVAAGAGFELDGEDVPPPAWAPVPFLRPADFMLHMQQRHGWTKELLEPLFAGYQANAQVIRLMDPAAPSFKRSWQAYRKRFIEPRRIALGKAFWDENQSALERAARRFGVPPFVVVGIIGVETIYGRNTGNFQVLDALSTLSFDYPRRAAYFAKELEHYLLWTREYGVDPASVRGSFAGAVGLPQFMPGSIRRHAVDFDGDGTVDLAGNPADAIGSVASFLKNHGWDPASRQALRKTLVAGPDVKASALLEAGWRPHASQRSIEEAGLRFPDEDKASDPTAGGANLARWAVFELPNGDAPSTWIATDHNFWVVTRYNQSPFYAMAVLELGEAVRNERLKASGREAAAAPTAATPKGISISSKQLQAPAAAKKGARQAKPRQATYAARKGVRKVNPPLRSVQGWVGWRQPQPGKTPVDR
jgi:membrane-bound lytic murein transglycosylase B